jgi:chemotaxis protein CheC
VLSVEQEGALADLFKVRCEQMVPSIAELTGQPIAIDVPVAKIQLVEQLAGTLSELIGSDVAAVHQTFTGPAEGDVLFALIHQHALNLTNLLSVDRPLLPQLDVSDREAVTEVANSIINACMGGIGDLLHANLAFAVPILHLDSFGALLHVLMISEDELHYGVVITVDFLLRESTIRSYLIVILDNGTTDRLIDAIKALG